MRALHQAIKVLFWLNGKWTELLFLRRLYFLTIIYIFFENTFRFNFLSLESYYCKKTEFPSFWLAAINLNKPKTDKKLSQKVNDCFRPRLLAALYQYDVVCFLFSTTQDAIMKCSISCANVLRFSRELSENYLTKNFGSNWIGLYLVLLDQ